MNSRLLLDAKADLGEGPLWSAHDQAIYWTDIKVGKLNRYRLADGATQSWDMPNMIGCRTALRAGLHRRPSQTSS